MKWLLVLLGIRWDGVEQRREVWPLKDWMVERRKDAIAGWRVDYR